MTGTPGEGQIPDSDQAHVQAMKVRLASPTDILDLSDVKDLTGIKVDGNTITIGAMTRHADVEGNAEVKKMIPALAILAGGIGDRQVRNMVTIGGSLANKEPAACYSPAARPLRALITT